MNSKESPDLILDNFGRRSTKDIEISRFMQFVHFEMTISPTLTNFLQTNYVVDIGF